MEYDESKKGLETLPWQALYNIALEKGINESEINGKEKNIIIEKLLIGNLLSAAEIHDLVNNYIYGDRVSFTLWSFNRDINDADYSSLLHLNGISVDYLDSAYFRNLCFIAVEERAERLEIVYTYSKKYSYIDEDGHDAEVWEQHRGCIWIGRKLKYFACISKHDKMTTYIINHISSLLKSVLTLIRPPKTAIERCLDEKTISRIVLQGTEGEKTIISRPNGLTPEQEEELSRIRNNRLDTSGSYIAKMTDDISATIKYNIKKGSISIHKHLSTSILFSWTQSAINIIFEEIENLKGKPAEEIFTELGIEIKWPKLISSDLPSANWFLTQIIASANSDSEYIITIPTDNQAILENTKLFTKFPRVYCNVCDCYETPHCNECGNIIKSNNKGILNCECKAPLKIVCPEGHYCQIEYWYLSTETFVKMLKENYQRAFNNTDISFNICITKDTLHILPLSNQNSHDIEIQFDDIVCFHSDSQIINDESKIVAVHLNEKCTDGCSYKNIEKCLTNSDMVCLPKIFYNILPGYRPQPHKGLEYGDIAAQIKIHDVPLELKGIIKKNSKNTKNNKKTDNELIYSHLLSTSNEGQEIIRQFVEQGMIDNRCQIIAIIAPQYFDASLKGTLRYLARLANKKVVFVELDEVCKLIQMNSNHITPPNSQEQ